MILLRKMLQFSRLDNIFFNPFQLRRFSCMICNNNKSFPYYAFY